MPVFFFDYRDEFGLIRDEIGVDLPDWETAYLEAYRGAIDLWAEARREGLTPRGGCFEIRDEKDRIAMDLPLQEALGELVVTAPRGGQSAAHQSLEQTDKEIVQINAMIALGDRHIADQHTRIARLKSRGYDASLAERLLATLLQTQGIREERRAQLLRVRSALSP